MGRDLMSVRDDLRDNYADAVDQIVQGDTFGYWESTADRNEAVAWASRIRRAFLLVGGDRADIDHVRDQAARRYANA